MRNHAVGGGAFRDRHIPLVGRGLNQHLAGGGASLAQVILRGANADAAAGIETAPDALAGDTLTGRRIFGRHLRPIAFEFFRHQLRETGQRALPHFRTSDTNDHGVVWPDHHPGIDFRRTVRRADHGRAAKRKVKTDRKPAANGCEDKGAAIHRWSLSASHHGFPSNLFNSPSVHLSVGGRRK